MQRLVIFLKMETANYGFLFNDDTFLEIMKCRLLSEPVSEQMLFRASTCVTDGAKGILNTQNPPVLWNKSGVERQRE